MWAEELLMIEKMVTSLQNTSAHISGKLPTYLEKALPLEKIPVFRHDICQKIYATAVLEPRILRKKRVNRNISQFATKRA